MKKFNFDFDFEIKEAGEQDDGFFYFSGYASTKDLDQHDDIVEPEAFRKSLKERIPVMLWQHDMHNPIGTFVQLDIDDIGLYVRGRMPMDDDLVRGRVIPQIKIGSVRAMSIGFITKRAEWDESAGIRIVKEVKLLEISLVTLPANVRAQITALKTYMSRREEKTVNSRDDLPSSFADRSVMWDSTAAEARVREWADAEEGPNERYRSAFLWYDDDNQELFGSYKLQVVDVIDGTARIVPRGVFAVRAVLSGARGGVDIPPDDDQRVKNIVNELYAEMDLEEPFSSERAASFCLTELKNLAKGDIAYVVRNGLLSKDASRWVTDLVSSGASDGDPGDTGAVKSIDELTKYIRGINNGN